MQIHKAILTGGGHATRLRPLTSTMNKHLIPLAGKPMIFQAIEKVVEAGVEEIFINTNPGDKVLPTAVGDGSRWEVKIKFFEQTGGPQGIAHVVNEAKNFIGDEPFIFYLSDNIILGSIKPMVDEFNAGNLDCMLALSKVPDPQRFGVPVFDKEGKLIDVWEKPNNPPNDFAVTGIYLYGPKIFFDVFQKIERSGRGEYEISSIHSYFLQNNFKVGYKEITGWWKDTGKPDDLLLANKLLMDQMPADKMQIGANVTMDASVKIIGPVIIGDNCVLENCVIGPYVDIGAGGVIKNTKISESIVWPNCQIANAGEISKSLIGAGVIIKKAGSNHCLVLGENSRLEI